MFFSRDCTDCNCIVSYENYDRSYLLLYIKCVPECREQSWSGGRTPNYIEKHAQNCHKTQSEVTINNTVQTAYTTYE